MGAGQGEREGSAPAAGRSLGLPSWNKVPGSQPGSHGVAGTWSHIWGVHQAGGDGGEPLAGLHEGSRCWGARPDFSPGPRRPSSESIRKWV